MEPLTGAGDRITSLLTSFLDVQSRRTQLVSENLANADTPGYVARELDFAAHLRAAADAALQPQGTNSPALNAQPETTVIEQDGMAGMDGNNVDAGREMSTLAEAGMQYLTGAQMLQMRFRTLRAAIRGG